MFLRTSHVCRTLSWCVLHKLACRAMVLIALLGSSAVALPLASSSWAQVPSIQTTLETGLKCRKDREFAFVAIVSLRVRTGELPEDLMIGTMRWAQKRKPDYPFAYFEVAVIKQAKALGVSLQPD